MSTITYINSATKRVALTSSATGNTALINAALAAMSNTGTLTMLPGTYVIDASVTIPTGIVLDLPKGVILKPANGVALTVNAQIKADLSQHFDLSLGGTVIGTPKNITYYPQWFGAVGDGSSDDYAGIAGAVALIKARGSGILRFPYTGSGYRVSSDINITSSNVTLDIQDNITLTKTYANVSLNLFNIYGTLGAPLSNIEIKGRKGVTLNGNGDNATSYIYLLGQTCTFDDATDVVEKTTHGLVNGDRVKFSAKNNVTGFDLGTFYYVVNKTDNTFQISATVGGVPLTITETGTGTGTLATYGTCNTVTVNWCNGVKISNVHFTKGLVNCLEVFHTKDITIDDIELSYSILDNGLNIGYSYENADSGIDLYSRTKVSKSYAHDCADFGFTSYVNMETTFDNCFAYNCGSTLASGQYNRGGGYSAESSTSPTVSGRVNFNNCYALDCIGRGFVVQANNVILDGCETIGTLDTGDISLESMYDYGVGCSVFSCTDNVTIKNSRFINSANTGISYLSDGVSAATCIDNFVIDNVLIDGAQIGINAQGIDNLLIQNYTIKNIVAVGVTGTYVTNTVVVTNRCTSSGNVTITLGGVAFPVAVLDTDDTTAKVATKLRDASYTGWTTSGTDATVIFTATTIGNKLSGTVGVASTGVTATISNTNNFALGCGIKLSNQESNYNQNGGVLRIKNGFADTIDSAVIYSEYIKTCMVNDNYGINMQLEETSMVKFAVGFVNMTTGTAEIYGNKMLKGTSTYITQGFRFSTSCGNSKYDDSNYSDATTPISDAATARNGITTATYDPGSLDDGAGVTTTVTVTGAALGDLVLATFSLDLQGILMTAYVSATNTVSIRFQNETGGVVDLNSGTIKVKLLK